MKNIYGLKKFSEKVGEIQQFQEHLKDSITEIYNVNRFISEKLSSDFYQNIAILNHIDFSIQIPDLYFALPLPTVDTSSILPLIDSLIEIVDSNNFKKITTQIVESAELIDGFSKRIAIDLAAIQIYSQSIFSDGIIPSVLEFIECEEESIEAFKNAGWPYSPSIPQFIKERAVDLSNEGKSSYCGNIIIGYFKKQNCKNLTSLVNNWMKFPLYNIRSQIFDHALSAHIEGKYTLSIPTLLPQIEGILSDYVQQNNLSERYGKITNIYESAIGDIGQYPFADWIIIETLIFQLQNSIYQATDLSKEFKKSYKNRKITRHTILHGANINYNNHSTSLKIFLLLDAITRLKDMKKND